MEQKMNELIYEVFVREERSRAELRLSPQERDFLAGNRGAVCTPTSGEGVEGKRWYLVELDPWYPL